MAFDMEGVQRTYNSSKLTQSYLDKQQFYGLSKPEWAIIKKYSDCHDRVMDIGCGTGRVCMGLENVGYKNLVGVDVSERMICLASQNVLPESTIRFERLDIIHEEPSLKDFKLALAFHGISPIPNRLDRIKALKNISRLLVADGIVILSTFLRCDQDEFWRLERERWQNKLQDKRLVDYGDRIINKEGVEIFIHIPSKKDFTELIEEAGYSLLECIEWDQLLEEGQDQEVHKAQRCTYWVIKPRQ